MTSPALGPVAVLGAHILDVLGRPVETIPPGQGSLRLAEIRATAAGTAAGTAVDLAKLGASVLAIGALGDDLLGDMVVAAMARHRVDVSGLSRKRGAQTSATILPIRANGERPALHVPGATPLLELADVDLDRVRRSRTLLIGAPDALGPVLDDLPQVVKGVKVFVAFVIFSMFAILVVGSGAQARLVYSMSRDNMLPFSGTLRRINIRSQTPIIALLVFGVIDLGVMIYGYFQTSAFGTLVGATAIIPYIIYFLITLAYALKRRTLDSIPGAFTLGRWAWPVIGFVLVYTVVVMLVLSLPAPFHGADKVLGYGLALAAAWYFGGLLWRLRKGTAGVKPVEDLVDAPRP
jgi:hypothetical protein